MSSHCDPTDFDAVIGYYNIGSLNRQQENLGSRNHSGSLCAWLVWLHPRPAEARIQDPTKGRRTDATGDVRNPAAGR
jgi:hypothetical protein